MTAIRALALLAAAVTLPAIAQDYQRHAIDGNLPVFAPALKAKLTWKKTTEKYPPLLPALSSAK